MSLQPNEATVKSSQEEAAVVKTANIGYLIPEFPGQTHNFFWRERRALAELGLGTRLISTRRPPNGIVSASWAREAEAETSYLYPFSPLDGLEVLVMLLMAGPKAWYRCAALVGKAAGMSAWQKLRLAALIPFAAKLALLGRKQGWSHVHVHSCADAANLAMFASTFSECTYSLTLHGRLAGYGPNQEQKWSNATFAISITRTLRDELADRMEGHLPKRLEIAPMGVDENAFRRTSPYLPYSGEGELVIFSCGRLNKGKGYLHLVQAVAQLKREGFPLRLVIAGEDEQGGNGYRKELEKQISDENLHDAITLLGAVPEEKIREYLETAHLFVLASLDEALGVVLMEAMAMCVPVVATEVGGVHELVWHGEDGVLVPPGDAGAIANAIRVLAGNPELALRLSLASRRKIIESFSHRRSAETIARLLDGMQVRSGKRGSPS